MKLKVSVTKSDAKILLIKKSLGEKFAAEELKNMFFHSDDVTRLGYF